MKRPKSHQIDTEAQRIFNSSCPTNWVIRNQHPDYGIDYDIEVFQDEKPLGIWFKVQLKGKETIRETEDFIKIPFETNKIQYYLSSVPLPVFLFVVLTKKKEVYWLFIQKYVNEILKNENPEWIEQKYVTINIPKENVFSDYCEIETEAKKGMKYLYILLYGVPHWSIPMIIDGTIENIEKLEEKKKTQLKELNEMQLHLANKYFEKGTLERSQQGFKEVFDSTKDQEDYILEHLSSIAGILSFYSVFNDKENRKIFELSEYGLKLAQEIQNIKFIHYFYGLFVEASLYKISKRIWGVNIFMKINATQGGDLLYPLSIYQTEDYKNLLEFSKEYVLNLYGSFKNRQYWVSLYLLIRLIRINLIHYTFLITEKNKDELIPLLEYISVLIENSLQFANELDDINGQCEILILKARFFYFQNQEIYRGIIESVKDLASKHGFIYYITLADNLFNEFSQMPSFPEGPDDFPEPPPFEELPEEEIEQIYKMLIEMAGIDLESEDEIARIVKIGLKDRNPGQILRNCTHIEIAPGSYGIPGEILGLPTAGPKFLFCKYGDGFFGLSLDTLYNELERRYCRTCKYKDPMPEDWKWSLTWQKERHKMQSEEFKLFIKNFNF